MNKFLKIFIDNPVLSTVISIVVVILGILGFNNLPVTQYPQIAPPTVEVTATFPGAGAQTILESVVVPLEQEINGVQGIDYITSTASNSGNATITIFFKQGTDPDIAAVNVQNRVARANPLLPAEVINSGIVTQKKQNSSLMYLSFRSTTDDFDEIFVQNYIDIKVVPVLQRIEGVAQVSSGSGKAYTMRIWIKPDKLAAYGLQPSDVLAALNEQSVEAAPGTLGQNSGSAFEYALQYQGRFSSIEEYENIVLKAIDNNQYLTLKQVADIELDAFSYTSISETNGERSVGLGIFQSPGSNAQKVIQDLEVELEQLAADFPKGMDYIIDYNINDFLEASIDNLINTFLIAFALVFVVVFVFLQDIRTTIIPAIAVPVSVVGTFFFLNLLGYSLNLLTLFALILAIGIVVDDAIVVTEAVKSKMENGEKSARKASIDAMKEISGAIIATTLVMAAVFIPVTFLTGPTGIFFEQFGVTLIISIVISSINALTLSPALSALILKPEDDEEENKNFLRRFFNGFNQKFDQLKDRYESVLNSLSSKLVITGIVLAVALGAIFFINNNIPKGFVPTEDKGVVFANVTLPDGASMDRTYQIMADFSEQAKNIEGIESISFSTGSNFFNGTGGSYALAYLPLEKWSERDADSLSINSIIKQLNGVAAAFPDAQMTFFQPAQVPGYSGSGGFSFNVLSESDASLDDLNQETKNLTARLNQRPEIAMARATFSNEFPQYQIELDLAKIKAAGIDANTILGSLQGYIGGIYASNFSKFGKQYKVYVQALPEYRRTKEDFKKIFVRNDKGEMAPITEFFTLKEINGAQSINRFNLFNAIGVNGSIQEGYSTGDAIATIKEEAQSLKRGYKLGFNGLTREEIEAEGQLQVILVLSLVFMYFFLAVQYKSYIIPLAVILSLPLGVLGSYLFTYLFGLENNIYFRIALIMLVGLLAKNAILIVEFGQQKRRDGESIKDAAIQAAKERLRPVLMTSIAFIAGMVPLIIASGVGAKGNRSIGTGAAGGLFVGTLLLIIFVPMLFIVFQNLHEKVVGKLFTEEDEDDL
ncbi:multidrug transporter AcrB [Nonlabens sp. YIK11]|uniref:efflux RND transporter permease subunit n=1 Tax=Nonlabens sp. YIK11 TaxID=1453349 RepID=UPI0006DC9A1D|nr:efflux RND transporter permease subunit [Nonlabens sp. YIK11]KQC33093.1 multidrug transporter AcrB [Nonlabens sp. YIK11]